MRAVLALALLALLAAPALAGPAGPGPKGPGGKGPGPKPQPQPQPPKPFKTVTGTFNDDGSGVQFNGKPFAWGPAADESKEQYNIVSNLLHPNLTWQLVGKVWTDEAGAENLYSVSWAYGAVVKAEIDPVTNKLGVTQFGDKAVPIRQGRTLTLGPKVSISYTTDKRNNRVVDIVVLPFIKVRITQNWVKPLKRYQKGFYEPVLQVAATLTQQPAQALTGYLAGAPDA